MKRRQMMFLISTLSVVGQLLIGGNIHAAQRDLPTETGVAMFSIIGTVIALPVKVVTCGGMAALGGVGYGLTLGESEFVQEEFLSSLPDACRPVLKTTPMEIDRVLPGPRPQDAEW
jgi:hypothetical protein